VTLSSSRRRVRLWFGHHQIADFIGEAAHADRYEAAMRRRFPGLQITNELLRRAEGQDVLPRR
jgi:hypothetical protein